MKPGLFAGAFALGLICIPRAYAASNPPVNLQVEKIVLLMRHGVRPPTHEPALPPAIAPQPWPAWPVPPGYLTPHGARAITLLGSYERDALAAENLLPSGNCPAAGSVVIYADVDERTVKTGEAFAAGFAPGCDIPVGRATGAKDPLFSPLDAPNPGFDAATAGEAMQAAAGGSFAAPVAANHKLFDKMQTALAPGSKDFLNLPAILKIKDPHRPPSLSGPIDQGASAGEDFLLEYLEGMPVAEIGWGRVTPADVPVLLAFHPLAYTITARPAYIADRLAGPLAARILAALSSPAPAPKLTVLVGHDTNIAALGGMLELHWSLGGYPADDPPPGGALGFALLRDKATGVTYVQAFYQVQTIDQIRNLVPLNKANSPALEVLPIPGCGSSALPTACTLDMFSKLVSGVSNHGT